MSMSLKSIYTNIIGYDPQPAIKTSISFSKSMIKPFLAVVIYHALSGDIGLDVITEPAQSFLDLLKSDDA